MTWSEAFGKAVYYFVAHVVFGVIVVVIWGIGAFFMLQGDELENLIIGAIIILIGLVIAVLAGPAIWIKVIGDVLADMIERPSQEDHADNVPASASPPRGPTRTILVEEPIPTDLSGMSAAELMIMAEEQGAVFSVPGPGRVSIDYFGTSMPVSSPLREALQAHKEEVIAVLEQRMERGEAL